MTAKDDGQLEGLGVAWCLSVLNWEGNRGASFKAQSLLTRPFNLNMLGDDEDVFDSVTWESASAPLAHEAQAVLHSGPGFKQSNTDSEGPNDPKWEGYLITAVKDPVKELADTKDAYVSYLVQARVIPYSVPSFVSQHLHIRQTYQYSPHPIRRLVAAFKILFF